MKRSPLQRRTPLQSKSELRRTGRLRPVSQKRQRIQRQRRDLVHRLLEERPNCQAGSLVLSAHPHHVCYRYSTDIHEPLTRARGGSILDEGNCLAICRSCHDWIHDHPTAASELGLLKSQYRQK